MTPEEIAKCIETARDGCRCWQCRMIRQAIAAEREACAKVAEEHHIACVDGETYIVCKIAAAIRSKG